MRIVLHIGLEKTGTTTIQHSLWQGRFALASQRVLYPDGLGRYNQVHLAIATAHPDRTADLRARYKVLDDAAEQARFARAVAETLANKVQRARPDVLVLSNEHLSSRVLETAEIRALHGILAALSENIRVVVYLRRQDELFLSQYSQHLKAACASRLDVYDERPAWLDFKALLDRWAEVFGAGNLSVHTFPPASGDLLSEFAEAAGLPALEPPRGVTSNPALDHANASILADINRHVLAHASDGTKLRREGLVQFLEARSNGPRIEIGRERRAALLADYAEGNEAVRAAYFPPDRERLFPDEIRGGDVPPAPGDDELMDLVVDIWNDRAGLADRLRAIEARRLRARFRRARNIARRFRGWRPFNR